jgi:hypothetical protein
MLIGSVLPSMVHIGIFVVPILCICLIDWFSHRSYTALIIVGGSVLMPCLFLLSSWLTHFSILNYFFPSMDEDRQ